jgi:hypothetical protein
MDFLEAAVVHAARDCARAHSSRHQLIARHASPLTLGDHPDPNIYREISSNTNPTTSEQIHHP